MMFGDWFLLPASVLIFAVCINAFSVREDHTSKPTEYKHLPIPLHGKREITFAIRARGKSFLWLDTGNIRERKIKFKIQIGRNDVSISRGLNVWDMSLLASHTKSPWSYNNFRIVRVKWTSHDIGVYEGCEYKRTMVSYKIRIPDFNAVSISSDGYTRWQYGDGLCGSRWKESPNAACPTGQILHKNKCITLKRTCKSDTMCNFLITRGDKCCNGLCKRGNCPASGKGVACDSSTNCHNNNAIKTTGSEENRPPGNLGGSPHIQSTDPPQHGHPLNPMRNDSDPGNIKLGKDNSGNTSQPSGEHVKGSTNEMKNDTLSSTVDGNSTHTHTHTHTNISDNGSYQEGLRNISKTLGSDGSKVTSMTFFFAATFILGQIMFPVLF